jgi:hypothetical protein
MVAWSASSGRLGKDCVSRVAVRDLESRLKGAFPVRWTPALPSNPLLYRYTLKIRLKARRETGQGQIMDALLNRELGRPRLHPAAVSG